MRRATRRAAEGGELDRSRLVRVICPYPLVAAGLACALQETALRQGFEPPEGDLPGCVVLWADDQEGLSEAVERVQEENPDVPILVLSLRNNPHLARAALKSGARGFAHAGMTPEQIARALEVTSKGEVVAPRDLLEFLLTDDASSPDLDVLSARSREVLELVVEGLTNAQIGKRLFLSESTIKQHLRAAYKRLGVSNRNEAAKLLRDADR